MYDMLVDHMTTAFQVAQHRDIIQNEYARANLAKSKLENLCRELQKHSKQVAVSSPLRGVLLILNFSPPPPPGGESPTSTGRRGEKKRSVRQVSVHH